MDIGILKKINIVSCLYFILNYFCNKTVIIYKTKFEDQPISSYNYDFKSAIYLILEL